MITTSQQKLLIKIGWARDEQVLIKRKIDELVNQTAQNYLINCSDHLLLLHSNDIIRM